MSVAVESAGIAIFTTAGCKYCKKTKAALKQANFSYYEINLGAQKEVLDKVKEITGRRTVPQVFIGGELLGGSEETIAAIESGELASKVQQAGTKPALPADLKELLKDTEMPQAEAAYIPGGFTPEEMTVLQKIADTMASTSRGIKRDSTIVATGILKSEYIANVVSNLDVLEWLKQSGVVGVRGANQPVEIARQLQLAQLLSFVPLKEEDFGKEHVFGDAGAFFRLASDAPKPHKKDPLNTTLHWGPKPRAASVVANELRERILGLYDKYLQEDGKALDYAALGKDPDFAAYAIATGELQRVDLNSLDRNELIAFFINIYNALIIHATVAYGVPKNLVARLSLFSKSWYFIGGYRFSPDDIEHGILRGNKPPPSSLLALFGLPGLAAPQLKKSDPRATWAVNPMDPRIHFALVCGAKSCPPIKLYTPDNLEEGLQAAGEAFSEGELTVDSSGVVRLSKIFQWYRSDFGEGQAFWDKIFTFLSEAKAAEVKEALAKGAKVKYNDYDWDINSTS